MLVATRSSSRAFFGIVAVGCVTSAGQPPPGGPIKSLDWTTPDAIVDAEGSGSIASAGVGMAMGAAGTAFAVGAMIAVAGAASATQTDFRYTATFSATVRPVYTRADNQLPYIDRDAALKNLDGNDFQISIDGYYDTGDVTNVQGGQAVAGVITAFSTNTLKTVLGRNAEGDFQENGAVDILFTSAGNFTLSYTDLPLLGPFNPSGTAVFSETSISSTARAFANSSATLSLLSTGYYSLSSQKVTDLYGVQKSCEPDNRSCFGAYASTSAYLGSGADVVNSVPSPGFDQGTLELFQVAASDPGGPTAPPAAVPEPASWVMVIAGFGLIGAALRRRRELGASFG